MSQDIAIKVVARNPVREFLLRISYVELYNEKFQDLLGDSGKPLALREDQEKNIFLSNITEKYITSVSDVAELLKKGDEKRKVAETAMNDASSRSHVIFRLIIESRLRGSDVDNSGVLVSHLNIIDLAGCEKTSENLNRQRFNEGCKINKSLLTLATVIRKLSEQEAHIPFRDSKLTRYLQNTIGGNSKTLIILTVSPTSIEETLSTLQLESEAQKKKQLTEELGSVLCVSSKNRRKTVCVPQLSRCKPIVMSPVKSTVLSSRLNMPPPNIPTPPWSPSKSDALSLPSVNYEKQFFREAAFQRLLATIQDLEEENKHLKEQLSILDASHSSMSTNTRRQTLVSWQDKSSLYEHNSFRPSGMETFEEEEEEVSSHSPSHPQTDHPLVRDSAALTQMPGVNNTESSVSRAVEERVESEEHEKERLLAKISSLTSSLCRTKEELKKSKNVAQRYLDSLEKRNEELREAVDKVKSLTEEVEKLQRKIECGKEFLAEKDQRIEESEQHCEAWQTRSLAAVVQPNRPNFYGAVPDIDVGTVWRTRLECSHDGVHRPPVAGIHAGDQGAFSIALSGGYEDDVDLGETFTYSGEGGRHTKRTKANQKNIPTGEQSKDQSLTRGNLALLHNVETGNPVRVIRGYKLNSPFAPEEGYRYDGLYTVQKSWFASGVSGHGVWKFKLKRCDGQAPPPWQITSEADCTGWLMCNERSSSSEWCSDLWGVTVEWRTDLWGVTVEWCSDLWESSGISESSSDLVFSGCRSLLEEIFTQTLSPESRFLISVSLLSAIDSFTLFAYMDLINTVIGKLCRFYLDTFLLHGHHLKPCCQDGAKFFFYLLDYKQPERQSGQQRHQPGHLKNFSDRQY
ncbi:hypothetical protein Btru_012969 [Bulinus truncatus]|nr:hypothetical protein Btru_012969 [Bulinus truncatus]